MAKKILLAYESGFSCGPLQKVPIYKRTFLGMRVGKDQRKAISSDADSG